MGSVLYAKRLTAGGGPSYSVNNPLKQDSPSPATAAAEPRAASSPGGRVCVGFTTMELRDDEEEPELAGDAYEFDPDQPAAERRDEMRARSPFRYSPPALERPASLAVQPPAEAEDVPAAGMPSGGGSAPQCAAGSISYAQCAAGMRSSSAPGAHPAPGSGSGAQSAAGTPSGSGGRRDSQLTNKGSLTPAATAAAPGAGSVEPRAGRSAKRRARRSVKRRYGPAVPRPETSPGGTVYVGFTPPHILFYEEEEPSDPEPDDATYEAYEFDPDQPTAERRDEMRARRPYY